MTIILKNGVQIITNDLIRKITLNTTGEVTGLEYTHGQGSTIKYIKLSEIVAILVDNNNPVNPS